LKLENYLKFGKTIIKSDITEERFVKNSKEPMRGFEMNFDSKVLQMFADTYELMESTNKGLLDVKGHFSYNSAPFEYVFKIEEQFYGIFYSVDDGVDYRLKTSIIKNNMTNDEAFRIIKKLSKDYVKHAKLIQDTLFKKGKKVLDDVILPNDLKQSILGDVQNFLKNRKKYKEFGMVWKRGYIFHGPPGNGKTLFLRKLGPAFGLSMNDMINRIDHDGTLKLPQYELPYNEDTVFDLAKMTTGEDEDNQPQIFYLEDMDKIIGKNDADFGRITLSNFLTAIDGVTRLANGLIIIGTSNYIDRLENSILGRPGRFDRVYEFKKPTSKEILTFFERRKFLIKDRKTTDDYANSLVKKKFSMAFVEDFVLTSVTKSGKHTISVSDADSLIEDLKHFNKLESNADNIGFGQ
jgi:SpoVK/Ycf46/Vps4 family AAA+-type ATPase